MGTENINTLALSLEGQGEAELEPGLRVTGHRVSNLGRVGSRVNSTKT